MNRYLVVSFLLVVPLYGLRKASEELVESITPVKTKVTSPVAVNPRVITTPVVEDVLEQSGNQLLASEKGH